MKKKELTLSEFSRLGALASNRSRTPAERKALAKKAIAARWARYRKEKAKEKGGGKAKQ